MKIDLDLSQGGSFMPVRSIREASIVRLEDGRIGWLGVGKKVVVLPDGTGVEVKPSTVLETLIGPALLARTVVEAQTDP